MCYGPEFGVVKHLLSRIVRWGLGLGIRAEKEKETPGRSQRREGESASGALRKKQTGKEGEVASHSCSRT